MPRDLYPSTSDDSPSPKELSLVASPESQTPTPTAIAQGFDGHGDEPQLGDESPGWENEDGSSGGRSHFMIRHDDSMSGTATQLLRGRGAQQANRADDLHPFVQTLGLKDVEACVALENACYEEHERASREIITYRLTAASELSLGLFSSVPPPHEDSLSQIPTYPHAHHADSSNLNQKAVLIGMILATKATSSLATSNAMSLPASWQNGPNNSHQPRSIPVAEPEGDGNSDNENDPRGHKEQGRTICIWSFGVVPLYQRKGLGKVLMKSYQQRMETSGIADRTAVVARGEMVGIYQRLGFEERGDGEVTFTDGAGGGVCEDMVYEFGREEIGGYS